MIRLIARKRNRTSGAAPFSADQRGTSLIEMLVALLVLGMTVSGIVAATFGAGRTGKAANVTSRMNVLITSFGEAIKALPYQDCGDASGYQTEFDKAEDLLTDEAQNLALDPNVGLVVVDVQGGQGCPDVDTGVQTITLKVMMDGRELTRQIVKRTPEPSLAPFVVDIKAPIQRSIPNNADVLWGTEADPKEFQVFQYEWWCGDPAGEAHGSPDPDIADWPTREPDFPGPNDLPITSPKDTTPECRYDAPPDGTQRDGRLYLRAVEMGTNRVSLATRAFPLPTTTAPRVPPVARWEAIGQKPVSPMPNPLPVPTENCTQVDCARNTPVVFTDVSPPPIDAGTAQWIWDFGDHSPPVFCTFSAADPSGANCKVQQHIYVGGGQYDVTLTLVNVYGVSGSWKKKVHIAGPPIVRPIVDISLVTQLAAGNLGISPMKIQVNGATTHANGCAAGVMCGGYLGGIKKWTWDFGSGPLQQGANLTSAEFLYPKSTSNQTYTIRLTVEDFQGVVNDATLQVTLVPNQPPIGLTNNGSGLKRKGDIPFFRNAYFDFQFKNPPRVPGETIRYDIMISSGNGFCGVLGLGMNGKVFSFAAGAEGSTQRVRAQFSSSPFRGFNGVCATDIYNYYARTVRTTPYGTFVGDWSPPQRLDPEFF